MVYYTDSPRMNKRMVAGYYLFLCLIGFAVLLGPTGAGIPISLIGNDGRNPHVVAQPYRGTPDPSSCQTCHPDEYANWSQTAHHTGTFEFTNSSGDYVSIGGHVNFTETAFNSSQCASCHTTGYNASAPANQRYQYLGVGCYACHNTTSPYLSYSSDVCAPCHTTFDSAHPYQYTDWENSAHVNSLTDLRLSTEETPAPECMHCMSAEGFIDQAGTFEVNGSYNAITCVACHDPHGNFSINGGGPGQIRAVNDTELCRICHDDQWLWFGGPHNLAGVMCTNCHGYDLVDTSDTSTYFLNHTFVVKPELACGQPNNGCHQDNVQWALNQLQTIQSAYNGLVNEMENEISSLNSTVVAYNATAGANHTLVNEVEGVINNAQSVIDLKQADGSFGFHNSVGTMKDLNTAYAQLLNGKAYFYESIPPETVTVTNTVTNTVTTTVTTPVMDPLYLAGGAVGGIVIGLILGLLVGRRR